MPSSKRDRYSSRMFAILFLFLNCVCIVVPGSKNISESLTEVIASLLGHDLNSSATEENQLAEYSLKHRPARLSTTSSYCIYDNNFYGDIPLPAVKKNCKSPVAATSFLPRPEYYAFLFRFTLF